MVLASLANVSVPVHASGCIGATTAPSQRGASRPGVYGAKELPAVWLVLMLLMKHPEGNEPLEAALKCHRQRLRQAFLSILSSLAAASAALSVRRVEDDTLERRGNRKRASVDSNWSTLEIQSTLTCWRLPPSEASACGELQVLSSHKPGLFTGSIRWNQELVF